MRLNDEKTNNYNEEFMRVDDEKTNSYNEKLFFYPFLVNERNGEGRIKGCSLQEVIHGFGLTSRGSMHTRFFDTDDTSVKNGDTVYEIRVRDRYGQWNDWQALVGEVQIVSILDCDLEEVKAGTAPFFDSLADKFEENFEIRKSGILWRGCGVAQIIEEEESGDVLLKEVNPKSLEVKYFCQADNPCCPLENQIQYMVKFRSKYHAYDENGNRI